MDPTKIFQEFGLGVQESYVWPFGQPKNPDSSLNKFIKSETENAKANQLPKYYQDLSTWVESLSGQIKIELLPLLFIFFYDSSIIMIKSSIKKDIIRGFINQYSNDFKKYYNQEITNLDMMLTYNSTNFEHKSYKVSITKTSFYTLLAYLKDQKFTIFLNILQQNVNVKIISSSTQMKRTLDNIASLSLSNESKIIYDPVVSLLTDNIIDLSNEFLIFNDMNDKKLAIFDASSERATSLYNLPRIDMEEILYTASNFINCDRLSKDSLPTCAYFNFSNHNAYYDINDSGSLLSVCAKSSITKLFTLDANIDIDNLIPSESPINERTSPEFELINHLMVPRSPVSSKKNYFSRSLIGQRSNYSAFSHDSTLLLTCGPFHYRIWSCLNSNTVIYNQTPSINWCCDWNPYGYYYAIGSSDATANLYCFDKTKPIRSFVGHSQDVTAIKFHQNAQILATASLDGSIRIFDVCSGDSVRKFDLKTIPTCLAFHPNGKYLICGDDSGNMNIWDIRMDQKILEILGAHKDNFVSDISVSKEGTIIASAGEDIAIWDFQTISSRLEIAEKPIKRTKAKNSTPRRIKFSDTNLLMVVGEII